MFIFDKFIFSSFRMLLLDLPTMLFMLLMPAMFLPTKAPELDSLILCEEFYCMTLLLLLLLLLGWYRPVKLTCLFPPEEC